MSEEQLGALGRSYRERRTSERLHVREGLAVLPEFWSVIYGPSPGFIGLFSGARPAPGARLDATQEVYFAWPRETAAALAWIEEQEAEDRDIYQCAHRLTRWRRRKGDALPLHALYVDLDAGLPDGGLAPSALVESSPGRYQAYFQLVQAVPPQVGEQLNRRLALVLGADPSGWDLTQLLRIPGTRNRKYREQPLVRVVELAGTVYAAEELDHLLPRAPLRAPGIRVAPGAGEHPPVGGDPPIPLSRSALRVWTGEDTKLTGAGVVDRSASLIRIARMLHQAGVPRGVIVAALAERDATLGWCKYSERGDAQEQYHRVVDVVERGIPTKRLLAK